jgi:hypothetical protein
MALNKTENLFSPCPRSESEYQLVHKAQNRNVLLLAGKAYCNISARLHCRARLHGKGAICAVWYPATAVWYPATAVWYPATAVWYPATAVWYPATTVWYPATAV